MKYRIARWKFNNADDDLTYVETKRCRRIKYNSWLSLLAENEWNHLVDIDDKIYCNIIDAEIAFDNKLKEFALLSWNELEEKKYYESLDKAKTEIDLFNKAGKDKLFELKESGYIYFLIKDNKVVYIGQTYTLATKRPYAHNDKTYDKIMVYEVNDKSQLNSLESYLIYKYNPFYNNHPGPYGQDKLKGVLMLMEHEERSKQTIPDKNNQ
jgi:hypothetical protein